MESPQDTSETGWRGSRDGWLEAGYHALIEGGVDAVKIQPLAKRLNLSRTSFYWFFDDRDALLGALIDGWDARTTDPLIRAAQDYAETLAEAMLNVLAAFLSGSFDAPLEFAVRSWALQDASVADRVQAADQARLTTLRNMLTRWGQPAPQADIRARTIYLTQIGYISMRAKEDMPTRLARIPTYVEIYTGTPPEPREIARFMAKVQGGMAG
ncbi:MAG: TetR/AcrR family transcriptional regulator [Paracoccus sp. (in: a-proteobacteria)]|uniref:TetR/AcrR family transcriptional regulator n=1 Tax=Paracoccus sp. TaxID=267 RepID=UPI0026E085D7|nr:TetR/AcrR family transcriptional regulator [Paracoccus sp. (in: a-proteobacteria)]MDO5612193.1 TetR/AcrR family transcriptional regulator [Paracoccus sp. (in: a-proteobacteria)]